MSLPDRPIDTQLSTAADVGKPDNSNERAVRDELARRIAEAILGKVSVGILTGETAEFNLGTTEIRGLKYLYDLQDDTTVKSYRKDDGPDGLGKTRIFAFEPNEANYVGNVPIAVILSRTTSSNVRHTRSFVVIEATPEGSINVLTYNKRQKRLVAYPMAAMQHLLDGLSDETIPRI